MDDARTWKRRRNDCREPLPRDATPLTTPVEPPEQKPASDIKVPLHAAKVATDPVILDMALKMATAVFQHGYSPAGAQRGKLRTEFFQLLAQPFTLGLATNHESTTSTSCHHVCEAEKIESLGTT